MRSMDELATFYTQFGVTKDEFLATAQSFAVDAQMRREQMDVRNFGITGTPSMVVKGLTADYRVSSSQQVSSFEAMLDVVDFIVAAELATLVAQSEASAEASAEAEAATN